MFRVGVNNVDVSPPTYDDLYPPLQTEGPPVNLGVLEHVRASAGDVRVAVGVGVLDCGGQFAAAAGGAGERAAAPVHEESTEM